jgi:inner membrane protein
MPSIFSHAVFAGLVGRAVVGPRMTARFWLLTAGCAMLPDADAVGFWFQLPEGSIWRHRGITHSIFFAALVGIVVSLTAFRNKAECRPPLIAVYFFLVTLSHPLLDMLTTGPWGVAIFAPVTAERYQWPVGLIEVSPIGLNFFSQRGLEVFASELLSVWLPSGAVLAVSLLVRRLMHAKTPDH